MNAGIYAYVPVFLLLLLHLSCPHDLDKRDSPHPWALVLQFVEPNLV